MPEKPLADKPLHTINYIPQRDGRIPGLGGSLSSCEALLRHLAMAHVIKVPTNITFWTSPRCPCGGRGRPWRPADRRGRPAREGGGD